ncbi:MAG: ATPase [bacterium]
MEILTVLERVENLITGSFRIPLTDKVIVSENEILELVDALRSALPDEVEEACRIVQEKQKVLQAAQEEAESVVKETKHYIERIAEESEITRLANEQANDILQQARKVAREIRVGANDYADELLAKTMENLQVVLQAVHKARSELKAMK